MEDSGFALRNWKKRQVTRHSAIAMSLYLFELFGTTDFLQRLVLNPTGSQDVVHLTFTEFFYTLRDPQRNQTKPDTVNVRDYAPIEQIEMNPSIHIKSKSVKLEEISEVIILNLELLSSIAKLEAENKDWRNY
ncbi:hypothetical protein DAPPUDRAFT_234465 [Daphnia pulex]|uniref:Uncharacterized protein n=1 Tax=Daphnia pulex TaxID=6669 RepID=E9FWN8_DAPPU|nr:hypothetical protein DAPPUDRAFT_234465 [Daphnia pulex]|eukprot:EFX88401.1 hypothetical protein DAPPUDRAFT_234465 [Daphnia pulex]